jgi:hypothetical protein
LTKSLGVFLIFDYISDPSGVVIVGAALCVAIGVPIALEMQSQQINGFRHDLVRKLLSEVPLIDG